MLKQADDFIRAHPFRYENDPFRLYYHPMPPVGWMNDPNGLICYQKRCHLFYQFHPYLPENGPKYWGHMVSDDLVDWTYLPTALAPDQPYDATGCYSGSAIEKDGALWLLYTGHVENREPKEVQCAAYSKDGVHFEKTLKNPLIRPMPGFDWNFRDPKVWEHEGVYYCLLGHCENGGGRVLLYRSADLIEWDYVGPALESDGSLGFMWECPDFFSIDGRDILLLSPEGMRGKRHSTLYMVGRMDYVSGRFTPETMHTLDDGNEFYAPQTFMWNDKRILIAWMDKWFSQMPTQSSGWACAMTAAREITLSSAGTLQMKPVDTLRRLCGEGMERSGFFLSPDSDNPLDGLRAAAFWLTLTIDLSQTGASAFTIGLRQNADGTQQTLVTVSLRDNTVTVDKTRSGQGDAYLQTTPIKPVEGNAFQLTALVDTSSLELLLGDGSTSVTNRIYPDLSSDRLSLVAEGGLLFVARLEWSPMGRNRVNDLL